MSDNLIIQRSPSGGYLAVPTTQSTVDNLKYAPAENRQAYIEKVFAPKEPNQSIPFTKRFMARHTSTRCFYCQDSKLQSRWFTMPTGGTYLYTFACACSITENQKLTSITALKEKLWCTLGGPHGMHCPLSNNESCRQHNCPKYEASYDRKTDICNNL